MQRTREHISEVWNDLVRLLKEQPEDMVPAYANVLEKMSDFEDAFGQIEDLVKKHKEE